MRALTPTLSAIAALLLPAAACAGPGETIPVPYSMEDAHRGAQFRAEAAIVIPVVFNPCGTTPALQPLIDRYREFESNLNPRQRLDLEIARADFDYQMSLIDIICVNMSLPENIESEKLEISVANSVLDRMDRLVDQPSGQEE